MFMSDSLHQANSIVRISNILNRTRQEFSLTEKHLLILTLFQLKHLQGMNQKIENNSPLEVVLRVSDLKETNYHRIKEALEKITSRKIYFEKELGQQFEFIVPFSYAALSKINSKAVIKLDINSKCKHLFLELAHGYTQADLNAIFSLKSKYSIRLYELLTQHQKLINWTIELSELQRLLDIDPLSYKYAHFERQILIYSQKELYEHCSLYFEWKTARKVGKKIAALTFTIIQKEKIQKKELDYEIQETQDYISQLSPIEIQNIFNKVSASYTLTQVQQDRILSDKKLLNEFVRIDLIIQNKLKKGEKVNCTRYMAKSLKL